MSNVKFIYFNIETIDGESLENRLRKNDKYVAHIEIKPGLLLVNFRGTARELYDSLSDLTMDNSILIYNLEKDSDAYWGYMNRNIWEWIKTNNN